MTGVGVMNGPKAMSALRLSTADIRRHGSRVVFVPVPAVSRCSTECYSITSSALASSVAGTVSPSALAVFRLITSSYLVGA